MIYLFKIGRARAVLARMLNSNYSSYLQYGMGKSFQFNFSLALFLEQSQESQLELRLSIKTILS